MLRSTHSPGRSHHVGHVGYGLIRQFRNHTILMLTTEMHDAGAARGHAERSVRSADVLDLRRHHHRDPSARGSGCTKRHGRHGRLLSGPHGSLASQHALHVILSLGRWACGSHVRFCPGRLIAMLHGSLISYTWMRCPILCQKHSCAKGAPSISLNQQELWDRVVGLFLK